MRETLHLLVILALFICLGLACSDNSTDPNGDTTLVSPQHPGGIMAYFGDSPLQFVMMWVDSNRNAMDGYNAYKSVGNGGAIKQNTSLIVESEWGPSGSALSLLYYDTELDTTSNEIHRYWATSVSNGVESPPSDSVVFVPAQFDTGNHISGLQPDEVQDVSLIPTFSWDAKAGASSYALSVQHDGPTTNPAIWTYRTTSTQCVYQETGGVTYSNAGLAALPTSTKIYWGLAAFNSDNFAFATSFQDVSASFTTTGGAYSSGDLAGTWDYHVLNSGDNSLNNAWAYGSWVVNSTGVVDAIYQTRSDGNNQPSCDGCQLNKDATSGIISIQQDASFHGTMALDKGIIVGVTTGGDGASAIVVLLKRTPGAFAPADLIGTWDFHGLVSGYPPDWLGWGYGKSHVDAGLNFVIDSIVRSDGNTDTPSPSTVSISGDGAVSIPGTDMHGNMSMQKDVFAATMSDGGGGYNMWVSTKRDGSFLTSDMEGRWNVYVLVSGNVPDSSDWIGWKRFTMDCDAIGKATVLSYLDSDGYSVLPTTQPSFVVSPEGIITWGLLHGALNSGKDILVATDPDAGGGYEFAFGVKR